MIIFVEIYRSVKILFSDNVLSGLLNFRGAIIESFFKQGHQVTLVAPQDPLADMTKIPVGARYIPVEMSRTGTNPVEDWSYYRALKRIYREERPDYIFHYTIKPNIYGSIAAHKLGIRSSAMIAGLGHAFSEGGLKNRIARNLYRWAMRYPEHILVLNRDNYDLLIEKNVVKQEKLILLEGGEGVDLTQFAPQPMPKHKKPVFLMIARLLYEKGYAEYVTAAEALKDEAEFRLMGSLDTHPSAVQPEELERDKKIITYIPHTPAVAVQIADADCVVLPSYHEGFSRVMMEGAAIGRPLIATDIAGCREAIDERKNGFLVKPRNTESLVEACRAFIALTHEQRVQMGEESRRKAERVFDLREVERVYANLI